jgi:hypothetical protein
MAALCGAMRVGDGMTSTETSERTLAAISEVAARTNSAGASGAISKSLTSENLVRCQGSESVAHRQMEKIVVLSSENQW